MSEGDPKNRVSRAFFDEFQFTSHKGHKRPKIIRLESDESSREQSALINNQKSAEIPDPNPETAQLVTEASWEDLLSQHPDMESSSTHGSDIPEIDQQTLSLAELTQMGESTKAQINEAFTGDLDELPIPRTLPNSFYIQFFDPDDLEDKDESDDQEVSFRKRDPTYVQDVIRLTARSKLIAYFRGENQEGRIFSEITSDDKLNLSSEEKAALQTMLHMGTGIIFSDTVIIAEAKRQICEKIGINSGLVYSFDEMVEIAKKFDAIFCQKYEGRVFGDLSKDNVTNISCVEQKKYPNDAVFYFATMTPSDRRIWILKTNPLRAELEENLMEVLGIKTSARYSIEDMKEFADRFDNNGRQGSGLISLMHLASYNALEVHDKEYTYREAIFYVLMPKEGRSRWLGLQAKVK